MSSAVLDAEPQTAVPRTGIQRQPAVPDPLPPKPKDARYHSFDFWRGAACLMLLSYHSIFYAERAWEMHDRSTWSAGSWAVRIIGWLWIGVPMFFVVSGYCIAGSVDSLRRKPCSLSSYFARRIRRIYPPLWIMLGLAVAFTATMNLIPSVAARCEQLPHLSTFPVMSWIGNITASESWLHQLSGAEQAVYLMPNTWTLCYEEQFYLVTGVILALSARRFFTAAGVITLLTLTARHAFRAAGLETQGFFFDGHWLMFAAGILVYRSVNYGDRRTRWSACGLLALCAVYAVFDRRTQTAHFERHLDEYLFVSSLFGIALIVFRSWDRPLANLKIAQPIAACGRMSYSIYLTHYLLVVVISCLFAMAGVTADSQVALLVVPVCLLVSLPPAWLFHRLVERRFMNTDPRSTQPRSSQSVAAPRSSSGEPLKASAVEPATL